MFATAVLLSFVFVSCGPVKNEETSYTVKTVKDENGEEHSEFYISKYSARRVKQCFDEVVLNSEYSDGSGDTSLVQKWKGIITYSVDGPYLPDDLDIISCFFELFAGSPGFPTVKYSANDPEAALQIHFVQKSDFVAYTADTVGDPNADGAATFYYGNDTNIIEKGVIYYNNEMARSVRRSVLLEELYNVMGAPNDTVLRDDSIVYQFFSSAEDLSDMDVLIMRLLYVPDIKCGMNADEANGIIDTLYF